MEDTLKYKTVKGVGWSFADNMANSGITFLVGLILARLLTPEEFGILGMITIFIVVSNTIIDSGFSSALIRKKDAVHIDYNTVFYFNLFISIFLYAILCFSAPLIGTFFHEPLLIPVTRVLGVVLVINSLSIIQRTLFIKKVDFKTQTKISFISSLSSGFAGITMAYCGCGIWSLVFQQIIRQFVATILFWIYNSWRPLWEFSYSSFKGLFNYGSKLLFSSLLDTLFNNIYYLIIGRCYSAYQLGQYSRAEQFNMISGNMIAVIQKVSLPVLCSIQDDNESLKKAYKQLVKLSMSITFAFMLGLAAIAKPLIIVLIGDQWEDAIIYLQIICFSGMMTPLHGINLNLLQVKGLSNLFLKLEIYKKIIIIVPITIGVFYGVIPMLVVNVFISFLNFILNSMYSCKIINYSTLEQVIDILPSFFISLSVALSIWFVNFLGLATLPTLFLQCILGLSLNIYLYKIFKHDIYSELKSVLFYVIK